ncbi:hypothetical protein P7C70_g9162, partial [Phenoliferia sp. Uapishka_3]
STTPLHSPQVLDPPSPFAHRSTPLQRHSTPVNADASSAARRAFLTTSPRLIVIPDRESTYDFMAPVNAAFFVDDGTASDAGFFCHQPPFTWESILGAVKRPEALWHTYAPQELGKAKTVTEVWKDWDAERADPKGGGKMPSLRELDRRFPSASGLSIPPLGGRVAKVVVLKGKDAVEKLKGWRGTQEKERTAWSARMRIPIFVEHYMARHGVSSESALAHLLSRIVAHNDVNPKARLKTPSQVCKWLRTEEMMKEQGLEFTGKKKNTVEGGEGSGGSGTGASSGTGSE